MRELLIVMKEKEEDRNARMIFEVRVLRVLVSVMIKKRKIFRLFLRRRILRKSKKILLFCNLLKFLKVARRKFRMRNWRSLR